nr:hypothetical protein CFP56_21108 [Quercus suber]
MTRESVLLVSTVAREEQDKSGNPSTMSPMPKWSDHLDRLQYFHEKVFTTSAPSAMNTTMAESSDANLQRLRFRL